MLEVQLVPDGGHEKPPKDTYVALRVGAVQKQTRVGVERTFAFPSAAARVTPGSKHDPEDAHFGRIEVYRRIGVRHVRLDEAAPTEIEMPSTDPEVGDLRFQVILCEGGEGAQVSNAPRGSAPEEADAGKEVEYAAKAKRMKGRVEETSDYLSHHNVEDIVAKAMREVLRQQPADPRRFLARCVLELQQEEAIKVQKAKELADLQAQAVPDVNLTGEPAAKELVPNLDMPINGLSPGLLETYMALFDLPKVEVLEQKAAFDLIDADNSGGIKIEELYSLQESLGLSADELQEQFQELDLDQSGRVSFIEFLKVYVKGTYGREVQIREHREEGRDIVRVPSSARSSIVEETIPEDDVVGDGSSLARRPESRQGRVGAGLVPDVEVRDVGLSSGLLQTYMSLFGLPSEEILEQKQVFDTLDIDRSGSLKIEELFYFKDTWGMSDDEIREQFDQLDLDKNSRVSFIEFMKVWVRGTYGREVDIRDHREEGMQGEALDRSGDLPFSPSTPLDIINETAMEIDTSPLSADLPAKRVLSSPSETTSETSSAESGGHWDRYNKEAEAAAMGRDPKAERELFKHAKSSKLEVIGEGVEPPPTPAAAAAGAKELPTSSSEETETEESSEAMKKLAESSADGAVPGALEAQGAVNKLAASSADGEVPRILGACGAVKKLGESSADGEVPAALGAQGAVKKLAESSADGEVPGALGAQGVRFEEPANDVTAKAAAAAAAKAIEVNPCSGTGITTEDGDASPLNTHVSRTVSARFASEWEQSEGKSRCPPGFGVPYAESRASRSQAEASSAVPSGAGGEEVEKREEQPFSSTGASRTLTERRGADWQVVVEEPNGVRNVISDGSGAVATADPAAGAAASASAAAPAAPPAKADDSGSQSGSDMSLDLPEGPKPWYLEEPPADPKPEFVHKLHKEIVHKEVRIQKLEAELARMQAIMAAAAAAGVDLEAMSPAPSSRLSPGRKSRSQADSAPGR